MRLSIGYAADPRGRGVAYARLRRAQRDRVVRCTFSVGRSSDDREVGFAALAAMLTLLRPRLPSVVVEIEDADLVADLSQRREIPVPLMLPYVRTRCALNAFESWRLVAGNAAADLSARAAAEVSLSVAA